jgi:hypothetical protein
MSDEKNGRDSSDAWTCHCKDGTMTHKGIYDRCTLCGALRPNDVTPETVIVENGEMVGPNGTVYRVIDGKLHRVVNGAPPDRRVNEVTPGLNSDIEEMYLKTANVILFSFEKHITKRAEQHRVIAKQLQNAAQDARMSLLAEMAERDLRVDNASPEPICTCLMVMAWEEPCPKHGTIPGTVAHREAAWQKLVTAAENCEMITPGDELKAAAIAYANAHRTDYPNIVERVRLTCRSCGKGPLRQLSEGRWSRESLIQWLRVRGEIGISEWIKRVMPAKSGDSSPV